MSNHNKTEHPFKNTHMSMAMQLFFSGATFTFKILGAVSPVLAGKLALRFFMTPPRFGTPKREIKLREEATLTYLNVRNRNISIRTWGPDNAPTVLLSHGWGGRCTQFYPFIAPLVEAGYRVLGFDVPGHGDSSGKRSNMLDVASIISEISKTEGPFEAVIGHSFGTGTALLAIDKYQVETKKVILIAYFSDVFWVIEIFGQLFSLRESTLEAMRQAALKKFVNTYGVAWKWEDISPMQTIKSVKGDILLIHDEKDHEIPYKQASPLQKVVPQAKVMTTSGYGHRKILMYKNCIETVVNFINGETKVSVRPQSIK
ncbi:MAG: alpha/beta hydrolase [Gammaproteobacteria bacterium]|nr:alpha/beta hydrolase [Gammaproteobacteria bacterium]